MQGCGRSGTLFAVGSSVFLGDLQASLGGPQLGLARSCAGDIGGILPRAALFSRVHRAVSVAAHIANL
eukprot:7946506-Pyramimonas_sp.AAC.1